jgi:hypothetical protein
MFVLHDYRTLTWPPLVPRPGEYLKAMSRPQTSRNIKIIHNKETTYDKATQQNETLSGPHNSSCKTIPFVQYSVHHVTIDKALR